MFWPALTLFVVLGTSHAQEAPEPVPPAAESLPEASVAVAAATVEDYRRSVRVDSSGTWSQTTTLAIRVDDPAAVSAGLLLPSGLDGAQDRAAQVMGNVLIVPPSAAPGTVYRLKATEGGRGAGHSGHFGGVAGLPVQQATLSLQAPASRPMHLTHSESGTPTARTYGTRTYTVDWAHLDDGSDIQATYSTWPSWAAAGASLTDQIGPKLADRFELGRVLAENISGMHLATASELVQQQVALDPYGPTDWPSARPAAEVVREGRGSPVDRGVVLLSLLKLAGHDAQPAYYRSARDAGTLSYGVPAPALLGRPVIVVRREGREDIYIDPANETVEVPTLPAELHGATVWFPGTLPKTLVQSEPNDGEVMLNGTYTLREDGGASWSVDLTASRAAAETLRTLLGPLDDNARAEALRRVAAVARPELARFTVQASGVENPQKRLKLTLSGFDEAPLQSYGTGLRGQIRPLLAPALAAWLPPNFRILETIDVVPPMSVEVIDALEPPSPVGPDAWMSSSGEQNGRRMRMRTEVERPYRATTAGREEAARAFLHDAATEGLRITLHAPIHGSTVPDLRGSELDAADRWVLEALLWDRQRNKARSFRALRAGLKDIGAESIATALADLNAGQERLWELFLRLTGDNVPPSEHLAAAQLALNRGYADLAWRAAYPVAQDPDLPTSTRSEAWVIALQAQPPFAPEDGEEDPVWTAPATVLTQLDAWDVPPTDAVRLLHAQHELAQENADGALAWLEAIEVPSPASHLCAAQALTLQHAAHDRIWDQLNAVTAGKRPEPSLLNAAAAVAADLDDAPRALNLGLSAARLSKDRPDLWRDAVQLALASGDLATAADAARRASDLAPDSEADALTLGVLSVLLLDRASWDIARSRNAALVPLLQTWPPSLDDRMSLAPDNALLAVLQQHDAETVADPIRLRLRAEMNMAAGRRQDAARDGILLAEQHGNTEGWAIAWASTAGTLYSTTLRAHLNDAANASVSARAMRMEVALLLGDADPTRDARAMSDDPRALRIDRLRTDPAGLAAESDGWPTDAPSPRVRPPAGYRANRWLSAPPGVTAVSHAEAGVVVLHTSVETGQLPPPLDGLYTRSANPFRSSSDGMRFWRLEGGPVPLIVGHRTVDGADVWSIGFSQVVAERALRQAAP